MPARAAPKASPTLPSGLPSIHSVNNRRYNLAKRHAYNAAMPITPEDKARRTIDRLLEAAGWRIQDRKELNLSLPGGVAVREFPMPGFGEADYLLFVDQKALGVVEAKKEGRDPYPCRAAFSGPLAISGKKPTGPGMEVHGLCSAAVQDRNLCWRPKDGKRKRWNGCNRFSRPISKQ